MQLPLVLAAPPLDRVVVIVAATPLELHVRRSPTGLVLAWWLGVGGRRLPVLVGLT